MPWDQAEVGNHALSGCLSFCSGHCSVTPRPPPGLKDLPPVPRVLSPTILAGSPRKSSAKPSSNDQLMQVHTHKCLATTWDKAEGSLHLQALSGVNRSPHKSASQLKLYLVGDGGGQKWLDLCSFLCDDDSSPKQGCFWLESYLGLHRYQ